MSNKGFTNEGQGGIVSDLTNNAVNNALSQTAGIISTKPTAKYTSGARTIIKINNKLAAFAFSVSWKITTDYVEEKTIDDYLAYELIPTRVMVEGTIGGWHVPGQSATSTLIQADVLSFLFHKYITIEVRDSATDKVLFLTKKAVITSRTEDLTAESLGKVQLTWKAIGWQDELPPKKPDGADDSAVSNADDQAKDRLIRGGTDLFNKAKGLFSK
jgi:hypothetical protein